MPKLLEFYGPGDLRSPLPQYRDVVVVVRDLSKDRVVCFDLSIKDAEAALVDLDTAIRKAINAEPR